jgi:hypothetical protein
MNNAKFMEAFEQGRLEEFTHVDHIRMAWIYLTTCGPQKALKQIVSGIQRFAAVKNATGLYHETITLFWICVVFAAIVPGSEECFDHFLSSNQHLTRKDHLFEYYSREVVLSDRARKTWVSPDLQPLYNPFIEPQSSRLHGANLYTS